MSDKTALAIAGFDPSSGAGVTADLAVFAAHGVFGTSAITALTVQSTTGVRRVEPVGEDLLRETLACLQEDLPPAGVKIGMLGGASQVREVTSYLQAIERKPLVVLDPVVQSSSGAELLDREGRECLINGLLPLVDVVTPNTGELTLLTGLPCGDEAAICVAAGALVSRFEGLAVFVTGGHREKPDDLLLVDGRFVVLPGEWVETRSTHGTGCAFSSALLCGLLQGKSLEEAGLAAKAYVSEGLRRALPRGHGKGPLALLWPLERADT